MKIPYVEAKDSETNQVVRGFYFEFPETTYCFTEDYEREPKVKLVPCVVSHRMTDWGLPNVPVLCKPIDKSTLKIVGYIDTDNDYYVPQNYIERISMTENEAIKCLRKQIEVQPCGNVALAFEKAIKALEEIRQYRAIGTVEGYENAIKAYTETYILMKEYKSKLQDLEAIGTVDEFKTLKEKKKMKPLKAYDEERESNWCSCPCCAKGIGWEYERHFNFCSECGTEFDWQ